jgi:aspartyl-tRNA(Asn)/glutamyl-tRNA(Gln) amidotransferase subunit A
MVAQDGIFLARPADIADGSRLAVKDLLDTAGLTTTYGSAIYAEHVPSETAVSVLRLEAAGYVNVGKTNLHEFAYGITSENPHFGTVPNPAAPGRIAGGSSGGSAAALAAGLADAALGSDSGGSIRIPAACCGVVGFKPTFDLVPTAGCFPLAPSFDHVGPMARTVDECEAMLRLLAPIFTPLALDSLDQLRVVIAALDDADHLVAQRVAGAAAHFSMPRELSHELVLPVEQERDAISDAFQVEVAHVHRDLYAEQAELYGEDVAAKVESCLAVPESAAELGESVRRAYRDRCLDLMEGLDLLITPTLPCVAPAVGIGDAVLRQRLIQYTFPFNALGWPALALPCGAAEDGLPASIQLVGHPGDDALVLAAGKQLARLLNRLQDPAAEALDRSG